MGESEDAQKAKRPRGRPKVNSDEAVITAIVRESYHLFIARGYAGTTMGDIAAHCHVSKRTLYRLFPGKIDLFGDVVEHHRQSMLALPGDYDHLPLDEALNAIFRIDLTHEENKARIDLIRLVILEEAQSPEISAVLHRRGADVSRLELARWLKEKHDAGLMTIDDPMDMAKILIDMVFGAMVARVSGNFEWQWQETEEHVRHLRRCTAIFLNGVRPRPEA